MTNSKWKFRQDDLDTIFTVINQGLMKKPYWVEYHDTYADGTPVWNGEKSVLWNLMEQAYPEERAQMMRRMLAKMEELGGLQKGTHQQKLFAFFQKYFFRVIDNFSSMLYNEDGKLYEQMKLAMLQGKYTNDTDPLGQSLGDGQSPEVAWVKKRIQYLQSKYSFGDYDAKTAEGAITVRTSAQADATTNSIVLRLTPAMKLYPTIAYGTTVMRGARTDAGKACEIVVDINGTSDQQLSVKSADYLLDIGDWSSYVINGALSIIGKRLKRLKLGDENEQNVKILISSLTLGNTTSLEQIDIQNISTLGGALDMRGNFRLRNFLAGGSSLTEAHFADGGALEEVDYPATTSYVELKNLDNLTNEKCNTEACAPNVMSYFVSGCDNLQPVKKLIDIMDAQVGQTPHALRYVRCVGFNETFTDGRAFDKLSQLVDGTYQGIDAEGQYGNDPYPVLDGTINLSTGAYRDTYDALMTHYPKLKLNIAKWWIRFEDPEVKRICVENWDKDGDGELSMEEAAAVSSIGTIFAENRRIRDLQVLTFTNIKRIRYENLKGCESLESITIPKSVDVIDWYTFGGWAYNPLKSLKRVLVEEGLLSKIPEGFDDLIKDVVDYPSTISSFGAYQPSLRAKITILRAKTPPNIGDRSLEGNGLVYVPDDAIGVYKHSDNWSRVADRIYPLSEYQG
nr:MAG TPA: putative leucine rich cell surface protein [Caudoviricetes sp.]